MQQRMDEVQRLKRAATAEQRSAAVPRGANAAEPAALEIPEGAGDGGLMPGGKMVVIDIGYIIYIYDIL